MEKKTMDTLRTMICGELEDIAKNGIKSHENLDVLKDLLDSVKNLEKIEKYQHEKEEREKEMNFDMDGGYSQRKYYIDADYNPYMPPNAYARGGRSYGMNNYTRDINMSYMGDNSYNRYYDPMYTQSSYAIQGGRYSGAGSSEAITELTKMMAEAPDEATKKVIADAITKLNK